MNTYAKNLKFRAVATKAGIRINALNEYSRSKLSIRATYFDDFKWSGWSAEATGFEFYGLDTQDVLALHLAGFELNKVEVPAEAGTKRFAYIYRLAI
jgi:hypothetical protein